VWPLPSRCTYSPSGSSRSRQPLIARGGRAAPDCLFHVPAPRLGFPAALFYNPRDNFLDALTFLWTPLPEGFHQPDYLKGDT